MDGIETPTTEQPAVEQPTEEVTLPSEEPAEELIAGKFKTQDDLLNAYKELEKKLGAPQEETKPEPVVDEEYEQWKAQKAQDELLKDVGGVDTYNTALQWAAENWSESQISEYNTALESANPAAAKLLAKSLIDGMNSGTTTPTSYHAGPTGVPPVNTGYETKSDMMKDMGDPRYKSDPAYRNKVAQKVAATDQSQWYKDLPSW